MTTAPERPVTPVYALLADGAVVGIRDATPADLSALRRLHEGLSPGSAYFRFFSAGRESGARIASLLCRPAAPDHAALLALRGDEVVGVASYERTERAEEAEVAFVVRDDMHGRGVGTLLLEHLVPRARRAGITRFCADTLMDNAAMLRVFADAGIRAARSFDSGVVHLSFPLDEDDEQFLDAVAARERHADIASLTAAFRPASIAVVGASRSGGIGRAVLDNLLVSGYPGRISVVNPRATSVAGVPSWLSPAALPEPPDLAVVAVPPAAVVTVAEQCGARGARALVVLTAGLPASVGATLLEVCHRHGMRLVGPNCMGVASSAPALPYDATFARDLLRPGPVGVVTQSGGVGVVLRERLRAAGVGISLFASIGDKYDVSANDLLLWWEDDPATRVAVVYVESFGNPRKFARTARRLGRTTPVLTVLGGVSDAGQRAAATHTSSAVTPVVSRRALFAQAGVIAVNTLGELVGATALLAAQPLPAGPRVAVLSNAGGLGVLAADACIAHGLTVPVLSPAAQAALRRRLPAGAAVSNPVDATAAVPGDSLAGSVATVAATGEVDAVLLCIVPTALGDLRTALSTADAGALPLLVVDVAQRGSVERLAMAGGRVAATFAFPEEAARALGAVRRHASWRARPVGTVPALVGIDVDRARDIVRAALDAAPEGGWLPAAAATDLLAAYGVPVTPTRVAVTLDGAVAAAYDVGFPVAAKAVGPRIVHKTERQAVRLALSDEASLRSAVAEMRATLGDDMTGVAVQAMAAPGVEVIVGITHDDVFGPLVLFGLGGVATDVLADHAARLTPLTDVDAAELVRAVRAAPLLLGHRGTPPVAVPALEDVLLRVARLADQMPEVAELDLNPVVARPDGVEVVDVRVRIAPREAPHPHLRRLR